MTISHDDTIWLAAWLEGEGWFGLCRGSISIQATSTDHDILLKVARLMDAAKVREKRKLQPHHKQAYVCRVTGNKAESVMRAIYPYMGDRRREKIDTLLIWRAGAPQRKAELMRKRWADPTYKTRVSHAIAAGRPKGDKRWSDAARRGWITRRG